MSTKASVASSKWSYKFNLFFLRKRILNSENECKRCVNIPRTRFCNRKSDGVPVKAPKGVEKVRPSDSVKQIYLSWLNKQAFARLKEGKHDNTYPDTDRTEHEKLLLLDVLRLLSTPNSRSSRKVPDPDPDPDPGHGFEMLMANVRGDGGQLKNTYSDTYSHELEKLYKLPYRKVSTLVPLAVLVYESWSTYHELRVADVREYGGQLKNTHLNTYIHEHDKLYELPYRKVSMLIPLAPLAYEIWSTCGATSRAE